jgi:hypothetical protein
MNHLATDICPALYQSDETAWLDAMAQLIREGRHTELDFSNLGEYLEDMARRDRREVLSRLAVLLAHLLKWTYQPGHRSGSWKATIETQRQELHELLESGVLRKYADEVLFKAYTNAVRQAVAETGLQESTYPVECPYSLEDVLNAPVA